MFRRTRCESTGRYTWIFLCVLKCNLIIMLIVLLSHVPAAVLLLPKILCTVTMYGTILRGAAIKTFSQEARGISRASPQVESIIRVDHAGELGADRIYAGQMAVLGNTSMGPLIQHMWDQEKGHRAKFEELIRKYRCRPTALVPLWNIAGFMVGAGSALLGQKGAMACTVAVETVIVEHYNQQLRALMADPEVNKELLEVIQKCRDEEQEHHDMGIDHGAEQLPFYKAFSELIKFGSKVAISIARVV